ncbi:MAG: glycosyltransferase [Sphaerospermopsis sp. SIO1G1]|nr:glycosyltransferase [Sphaerospermopsis sp. SIO1G1]
MISQKKILIVEEALKNYTGHWYEYNKAVTEFNRNAGIEVTIAAHKTVSTEVINELNAVPIFEYTNWDGIYYSSSAIKRYLGIIRHNWYIYKTLDKFLSSSEGYDCVFVPTVIIYHWIAWLFLLKKYQCKKLKRLVLFIRNNAGSYPNNSTQPVFEKHTIILRKILQQYCKHIQSGVVCLGTDSQRHAKEYNLLAGVDVKVFPHPKTTELNNLYNNINHVNKEVVISCLGPARLEKGIDVLQQAILHLLSTKPELNCKFIIQWNRDIINADGSKLKRYPELEQSYKVHFLNSDLSSNEYNDYLTTSDCIILPYRRQSYYTRLSGIAVEAAILGIPIIYTKDTWLEDAVSEYGAGLGVENENYLELAEKIDIMVSHIDEYRNEAIQKSDLARKYHSPDNFLQCLWGQEIKKNESVSSSC